MKEGMRKAGSAVIAPCRGRGGHVSASRVAVLCVLALFLLGAAAVYALIWTTVDRWLDLIEAGKIAADVAPPDVWSSFSGVLGWGKDLFFGAGGMFVGNEIAGAVERNRERA